MGLFSNAPLVFLKHRSYQIYFAIPYGCIQNLKTLAQIGAKKRQNVLFERKKNGQTKGTDSNCG